MGDPAWLGGASARPPSAAAFAAPPHPSPPASPLAPRPPRQGPPLLGRNAEYRVRARAPAVVRMEGEEQDTTADGLPFDGVCMTGLGDPTLFYHTALLVTCFRTPGLLYVTEV